MAVKEQSKEQPKPIYAYLGGGLFCITKPRKEKNGKDRTS